jgi:hypothetical protein
VALGLDLCEGGGVLVGHGRSTPTWATVLHRDAARLALDTELTGSKDSCDL